ncbi:MAG: RagB/SusD family nutrient uptake outer membrane protein [Ferruginibacter sp.]
MKHKKYLVYALALVVGFSSCKKELDLQPTDSFSDENAFLTISDIQLGVNSAYGRYGAYANDMYASALISDEAKLGPDNAGQGALTYRYQYASDATSGGDVTGAFGAYYAMIDQVNRVLPKVPTVTATAAEEAQRPILKGQLLALRAIAHFGLLQSYSKNYDPADPKGVPVMTSFKRTG